MLFTVCTLLLRQGNDHIAELGMLNVTGVPIRVRTHEVTKQVKYIGDVQNLVEKLSDLPAGGQVLMGPLTYQRIYSRLEEFRIQSLQKLYEQPARSAPLCATYPTFCVCGVVCKNAFRNPFYEWLEDTCLWRHSGSQASNSLKIQVSYGGMVAMLLPTQSHC